MSLDERARPKRMRAKRCRIMGQDDDEVEIIDDDEEEKPSAGEKRKPEGLPGSLISRSGSESCHEEGAQASGGRAEGAKCKRS